ncbi:MAG TPA: tetratricopeptide repeat protein [Terriglobia bacterium]|nr:tetratricopeptide repeat protein [Terriglobia bacterium]
MFNEFGERIAKHRLLAGMILGAITFAVFSGSLANGFVYDDNSQILQNAFILNPHLWKNIFTGSVWSFQGSKTNFYRPLQFACYWILYRLGGPNPATFHLLNLLIYALSAVLVYWLARRLFNNDAIAFAGALLWALHPVHVEAVAWISALPEVGFAFFALLSLFFFVRTEQDETKRPLYHLLAALSFFVALFFKEMALSFPFLLLAYWFFLGKPEAWSRRLLWWLSYVAATVAYLVLRHQALGYVTQGGRLWKITPRVAGSAVALLGQDTKILLWPDHLNVFRMFYLGPSLRSPWPWIALLCLVAAFWMRRHEPILAFLIVWWPVTLLPVLDIRQLSFPLLADRFLYFPSIGPCLAVAYLLLGWLPRWFPRARMIPAAGCAMGVAMIFCGFQTLQAIPHWRDNNALIYYSMTQSPDSPLLHMARGVVLEYEHGDLKGALREYNTAWRLNQQSSWPLNMAHDYYLAVGRILLRTGDKQRAIEDFKKAHYAAPDSSQPTDALGAVYFPQGDYLRAAEYFEQSGKVDPQDVTARFYLGTCWMKLGMYRRAAAEFHAARKVVPDYWQAYQAEASALDAAGDFAAAKQVRGEIQKP